MAFKASQKETDRGFRYQKRSAEDVKQRADAKGGNFDSIFKPKYKVMKVRDGKNLIRVMPPTWDNAKHYGYDIWVNYSIGVDNQSYLSLSKMKAAADPIAEARREAERAGDKELAKSLQPRQRILMWVIDRQDEDEGPQLFSAPFTVDKAFAALSFDEDTKEVIYIDDPAEGCDVRFYKEGQGLKTDYPPEKMRILKPSPLSSDKGQMREWLEFIQQNPVPDVLNYYSYDQIATAFDGRAASNTDDEDEDEPKTKPVKAKGRNGADEDEPAPVKRSKASPPFDPDQDEDDEDEEPSKSDEDEDDNEPPLRTRGRAAKEPVEDEDEDEPPRRGRKVAAPADDDDDDADEKPAPRGSSVRDRLKKRRTRIEDDE